MKRRILICEDEENIVSFLLAELRREGYDADVAYDGESALHLFEKEKYSLVLLDLMIPVKNGLEVLQQIRKSSNVPVIMLTARKDTFDKVLLLKAGADDYVTKPFDTMELIARIERNIKRNDTDKTICHGELSIDYDSFTATIRGNTIPLSKTEFEILYDLVQNKGKVLTRDRIARKLYGDFIGESNVVDVNVKNIRKKLAQYSQTPYIETVRGKGYVVRT